MTLRFGDRRLPKRFWSKVLVDPRRGCWWWAAGRTRDGYGSFNRTPGRLVLAHRHAYRTLVGPIPRRRDLDHLCRIRYCVNPMHLEAVTRRVNVLRGWGAGARNARVTRCPKGHRYTKRNTRWYGRARSCRACACLHGQAYRRRNQRIVRLKSRARYYLRTGRNIPREIQLALGGVPWRPPRKAKVS